jgi:hypothetical protein
LGSDFVGSRPPGTSRFRWLDGLTHSCNGGLNRISPGWLGCPDQQYRTESRSNLWVE